MAIFTNRATLTYLGRVTDSNTVTGTINSGITVTKTALNPTYSIGDTLTYALALVNVSASPLSLTVTDDLGADGGTAPLTYVSGSLTAFVNGVLTAAAVTDEAPLTFTLALPVGGTAVVIYEAEVNRYASPELGGTITNTASIDGCDAAATATAAVTAAAEPDLTITKALSPTTVTEDQPLTYTFEIANRGNTAVVATDDAVVSDTFDPILTISSVTFNGLPLAEGTGYSYNAATGDFTTLPGAITVPAATFTQELDGSYSVTPGTSVLQITGTL